MNTTPVLPSAEEEIWRYSRIGELDLSKFAAGAARTETVNADALRATGTHAGAAMETPADVFAALNREHGSEIALVVPRGRAVE